MIPLRKTEEPKVLSEKGASWTSEYLSALSSGKITNTVRFRYRHRSIKQQLYSETSGKCAYCESKVSQVHPGETDHIAPVSQNPHLYVEWSNLTFTCSVCNREKSDYFDERAPLVNPYQDDPSDHLLFLGPIVMHRDHKGYRTKRQLKLSRTALVERKTELLEKINILVQSYHGEPAGATKNFYRDELLEYVEETAEYSATIKSYLVSEGVI